MPKEKGQGGIGSTTYIRKIVQSCFDQADNNLNQDGFKEEVESITEATAHWLRHASISDDVNKA